MAHQPQFTWEQFVKTWQEAKNVAEVVEKIGVSRTTVESTATRLRKAGVQLKQMRAHSIREAPDVAALNALIKELPAPEGDEDEGEQAQAVAS